MSDKTKEVEQPVKTKQADYVLINNGSFGPITVGVNALQAKAITKAGGNPAKVTLYPGINRVPTNVWNTMRDTVKGKIVTKEKWSVTPEKERKGMLLEINYESLHEDSHKGFKQTTKANVKALKEYTYDEQEAIIKGCFVKNTLEEWKKEEDLSQGIYNLISAQIAELEKPLEKK